MLVCEEPRGDRDRSDHRWRADGVDEVRPPRRSGRGHPVLPLPGPQPVRKRKAVLPAAARRITVHNGLQRVLCGRLVQRPSRELEVLDAVVLQGIVVHGRGRRRGRAGGERTRTRDG